MFVSTINKQDLTPELIDRLLFDGIQDTGEAVECILVLGSMKASTYRLPAAVAAFHAGRAGKIMLCSGKVRDFPDGQHSEAQHMYRAALELGVPKECLVLENTSQNTVENIRFAQAELQKQFPNISRILLVTTAYHMRRSLAIARHIFPKHITVIPCPANDTNTRRDNWMLSPAGIERATTEAKKIIWYVANGVFPDFEV